MGTVAFAQAEPVGAVCVQRVIRGIFASSQALNTSEDCKMGSEELETKLQAPAGQAGRPKKPWAPSSFTGENVPVELRDLPAKATGCPATLARASGCSHRWAYLLGRVSGGFGVCFSQPASQGCAGRCEVS